MAEEIVNKVTESGIITLDLEAYYPRQSMAVFDLKDFLFMGMVLKEKDFREALKAHDWEPYRDRYVGVYCSADAIIPVWAYMLVTAYLEPLARDIILGDEQELIKTLFLRNLEGMDVKGFTGKRIVIKGCGDTPIGEFAYLEATKRLMPVARSIMYGEPCSTVPVFKKK